MSAPTKLFFTPQATSVEIAAAIPTDPGVQVYDITKGEVVFTNDGTNFEKMASSSDLADYLPLTGGALSGALDMGTNDISSVVTLGVDNIQMVGGNINCDAQQINNVGDPLVSTDAATKNYVDTTALLLSGGTMTGSLTLNADAATALEAVTYQQLTAAAMGIYRLQGGYDPTITSLYPVAANTTNPVSATVNQGMVWQITANGNINGIVVSVGDQITALVNTPGQTNANWNIVESNLGFTPISNVLPSAEILVGNVSNVAAPIAMSGDATISNSGALTVTKTNGVSFAASATTDTTNAANITSGLLPIPRLSGTYSISVSGNSATTTTIPSLAGDVSSTANTVTVTRVNGAILGTTTATSGNLLVGSGAQWITQAVSGDATLASTGALTLGTVNSNVGTFGSSSQSSTITVNAKGLVTAASNTTITPAAIGAPTTSGTGAAGTWGINVSGNAATVTTNANLTGPITSAGNATSVAAQTGTGSTFVMQVSPTLTTPNIGTPTAGTLSSCTGLPISTGVSGLGTGIATALAVNSGSAGAPVLFNGALGTPTSGVATNLSGTAASLTAGHVTTNANLTGDVTSTGNAATVVNINGVALGSTTATSGNVLIGSGTNWVTNAISGDATLSSAGAVAVTKINGVGLGSTTATSGNLLIASGSQWATQAMSGAGTLTSGGVLTVPGRLLNVQVKTVSGTYTPSAGAVTALVYGIGGGGGGGGSGTAAGAGGTGSTGSSTVFGAIMTVTGGTGGVGGGTNAGAGAGTGGVGNGTVNFTGSSGDNGSGTGATGAGGIGGASSIGGTGLGGPVGVLQSGGTAPSNSGGGGGGASGGASLVNPGGGGAGGGTGIIITPAISTSVTVGNGGGGGTAGTSGASAGNGARGIIYIYEYS